MAKTKKEVIEYYDEYTSRQVDMGVNARHKSIQSWLIKSGLLSHHDVLEIGCGIGTQTSLLAEYLNNDTRITANDISPKSVDIAKKRLEKHKNIQWVADDFIKWPHTELYDVILLPDVIEHIPIELHSSLFKKIVENLKEDGFVLVHIPNPMFLEWCQINAPEKLQVIDQAVHTEELIQNTAPHGLYIHFMSTYSIWVDNGDYTVIVMKKKVDVNRRQYKVNTPKLSFKGKLKQKVKSIIK